MRSVHELVTDYASKDYLGYKIAIHLDGARLFNAAVAANCEVAELAQYADSVNVCFSKGMGCPVGSVLAGSSTFIERARRYKKALGGAMRQSGVLAAPCLVALDEIFPKLQDDHNRALYVYQSMQSMEGLDGLRLNRPETNILMFEIEDHFVMNDEQFVRYMMEERGIRIHRWARNVYRFVFHHQIDDEMVEILLDALRNLGRLAKHSKV